MDYQSLISEHPVTSLLSLWKKAKNTRGLNYDGAVCVSTVDRDGFPSGRFVDLKHASESGLVFCSYYDSAKGHELSLDPKIALPPSALMSYIGKFHE
ncbi:pyridoxamine 5'-phosphate oxidase family protein [Vibrio profundum]|uniref:pyridoxamine 5'-phosphate oxidase family protein n=1 Tax=Vibrio profundum TaxID=2910247 RepID=UPI003D120467